MPLRHLLLHPFYRHLFGPVDLSFGKSRQQHTKAAPTAHGPSGAGSPHGYRVFLVCDLRMCLVQETDPRRSFCSARADDCCLAAQLPTSHHPNTPIGPACFLSRKQASLVSVLLPNFLFFSLFLKVFHKYVPGGKISESGPLAQRHRCWRRANTSRRQRPWRRALGLEANVAVTWQ